MSLISACVFSKTIQTTVGVNIITPYDSLEDKGGEPPGVLYLLHGLFGSQYAWVTGTNVARYVKGSNLMVVMPDFNNTFYVNSSAHINYFDFAAYELVDYIENTFKVSSKREDNFICGLSMGGYGAYRIALERPDKFSMAASLSGALDVVGISSDSIMAGNFGFDDAIVNIFKLDFGSGGAQYESENDLFSVVRKCNSMRVKPKLLQYCGAQDFLLGYNREFKKCVEKLDFDYTYYESEGEHDWDFWDKKIQMVLEEIKKINPRI